MFPRTIIAVGFFAVTFVSASLAMAQSVEIEATTPEVRPKFQILRPEAPGSEVTRPNDGNVDRAHGAGGMDLAGGRGQRSPPGSSPAWMAELWLRDHLGRPDACRAS